MRFRQKWRLVIEGPLGAARNMAVDEAILRSHAGNTTLPTIRFYQWEGTSISLGYFQSLDRSNIDLQFCERAGVSVVRRITGGKAVLHGHDITFSIIVPEAALPEESRSILGSHHLFMSGIVAGLKSLGVDATIGTGKGLPPNRGGSADCFAHASVCDVCVDGTKVAGAAQVRVGDVVLTQISIPCEVPSVDPKLVFGEPVANGHVILAGVKTKTLIEALSEGLAGVLSARLCAGGLTDWERQESLELESKKYGTVDWNLRRQITH